MAIQVKVDELEGCQTYLSWMVEKAKIEKETGKALFGIDFVSEMAEDDIRARDGLDLRKDYAKEAGEKAGKNDREKDRIWKSIHGKCSVMELFLKLSMQLDSMTNEGIFGEKTPYFMEVFLKNLGIWKNSEGSEGDKKGTSEGSRSGFEEVLKASVDRFLERKYAEDGSGGGLFPIQNNEKDQRKEPIWNQMNTWLGEHLDEDYEFLW